MIFPSLDYSGSGANRIDITDIEEKARTIFNVAPYLLKSDFEGYALLLNDLRADTAKKLGNIICGVSSLFCYGTDDVLATNVEIVDNYGASFVGDYCGIMTVSILDDLQQTSGHFVPSAMFSPLESDELPLRIADEYSGMVGELYSFVAVPLVGMPVVIERLPLA